MNWSLLVIASRNLSRNKRRSAVVAISVAIGVAVSIILLGTRQSAYDRMIDAGVKGSYGTVTVASPGYMRDPNSKMRINIQPVLKLPLNQIIAIPRITTPGMAQTAQGSVGMQLFAIDPSKESPATNLGLFGLKQGKLEDKKALVGDTMASRLGVTIGDPLVLSFADGKGDITNSVSEIGGIFHTGSPEMDEHVVLTTLASTQAIMGYSGDEASLVAFFTPHSIDNSSFAKSLKKSLSESEYEVTTWHQTLPELYQAITIDTSLQRLLCGFAGVIIGIGILNAMLLSVIERRREFGVVLAVGMTPRELIGLVSFEALLLGFVGLALGAVIAAPIYYYLAQYGFDLTPYIASEDTKGIDFVDTVLGCRLTMTQITAVSLFLILTTIIASIFPARKAANTEPIAAINGR